MTSRPTTTKFLALALVIILCTVLSACQIIHAAEQPVVAPVDDSVFDNDDLFAIMDEAEKLLQNGKYTIENPSSYVQYFLKTNKQTLDGCVETKENSVALSYSAAKSEQQTALKFGVFLHLICSRYPDAVCDADYTYTFETNRPYFAYLFFYPGYKDAGYKTALDACKAIDVSQKNIGDNAFYIHMGNYYEILEGRLSGAIIYKATP